MSRVLVIHGPNLNLLGTREPETYGTVTLSEINEQLVAAGQELGLDVETFQSNIEGEIVTRIQDAAGNCDGILINVAGYAHTSVAIRDALAAVGLPAVEVHMSDTLAREDFRRDSMLAGVVTGRVEGFGAESYRLGLIGLAKQL